MVTETINENMGSFSSEKWVRPTMGKKYLLIRKKRSGEIIEDFAYYFGKEGKNHIFYRLTESGGIWKYFSKSDESVVRKIGNRELDVPAFKMSDWSTSVMDFKTKDYLREVLKQKESLEVKANTSK